jgi:hypothetical protein
MSSPGQPRRIHGVTLALANEIESDKEKLPTMYKPSLVKLDEARARIVLPARIRHADNEVIGHDWFRLRR